MSLTPEHSKSRRQERLRQVEQCLSSDLTVEEWCRLNRVSKSTVYKWMRRFRAEGVDLAELSNRGWIEVTRGELAASRAIEPAAAGAVGPSPAPGGAAAGRAPITVAIAGAVVSIPSGTPAPDVAAVLGALGSL